MLPQKLESNQFFRDSSCQSIPCCAYKVFYKVFLVKFSNLAFQKMQLKITKNVPFFSPVELILLKDAATGCVLWKKLFLKISQYLKQKMLEPLFNKAADLKLY